MRLRRLVSEKGHMLDRPLKQPPLWNQMTPLWLGMHFAAIHPVLGRLLCGAEMGKSSSVELPTFG